MKDAAKENDKKKKISMMKTINMNFIAEQLELLNQYEKELADYNKAIGVPQSGVAAASGAAAGWDGSRASW